MGSKSPSPEPKDKVPKPGVRIAWRPMLGKPIEKKQPSTEKSSLSESEDSSDEVEKVIHVKPPKKQENEKDEKKTDADTKPKERKRHSPKSTGRLRDEPCKRCEKLKYMCFDQIGGKACIDCAKSKMRCIGPGEEEGYTTEVPKLATAVRKVKVVTTAPISPPSRPAPKRNTRSTKKKSAKQLGKSRAANPGPVPVPEAEPENTSIGDNERGWTG